MEVATSTDIYMRWIHGSKHGTEPRWGLEVLRFHSRTKWEVDPRLGRRCDSTSALLPKNKTVMMFWGTALLHWEITVAFVYKVRC